jgi:hypothetical protein
MRRDALVAPRRSDFQSLWEWLKALPTRAVIKNETVSALLGDLRGCIRFVRLRGVQVLREGVRGAA